MTDKVTKRHKSFTIRNSSKNIQFNKNFHSGLDDSFRKRTFQI